MNSRYTVSALALMLTLGASAQNNDAGHELAGHSHSRAAAYRPGEVIVKFRDSASMKVRRNARGKVSTTSVSTIDNLLKQLEVEDMEQLMPLSGKQVAPRTRAYNGQELQDRDLSQLYCLKMKDQKQSIEQVVSQLKTIDEVEYAEPNYLVYTLDAEESWPTDPLVSQQGYLNAVNVPALWTATADVPDFLDHRPVIAIVDTGVDIEHSDLADNIWTNLAEQEGEEGADDDKNGFKDDLHGWDFVNQTGRIGDWNGHGTHCAGIAAAVGGNGIGISGVNPDALIMPVTVMQSDGVGDMATIIKGVDYAFANGADVISMSIGGYAHSVAFEQSLAKAYSKCVLVAAAGNNCLPINPSANCPFCFEFGAPCYPAAFTFVLGVQAGDAMGMFTNFDDDGPVYSEFSEEKLYNYEVSAPGLLLMSTYPGGRYKALSGTSMACPLVAGVASRLIQKKEILSKEILFGDLINTSSSYINALSAFNMSDADRKPTLYCVGIEMKDPEGDNDGRYDAGEIVELYPTIRNDWGQAADVVLSLELGENEDPTIVEFLDNNVPLGSQLSGYAKVKCSTPLRMRISENCVDGRHIRLVLKASCANISADMEAPFVIKAENGVELGGTQRENITLEPGIQYIVTRNWGIPKDVIVTVKAGTTLKIHDGVGISNYGYINFEGDPNNMITITKGDNDLGYIGGFLNDNANYVNFNNVIFENLKNITFDGHTYEHCIIRNCEITNASYFSSGGKFRDCDIYNNMMTCQPMCFLSRGADFVECNVFSNEFTAMAGGYGSTARFYHSNYIGNTITGEPSTPGVQSLDESNCYGNFYDVLNGYYSILHWTTEPEITYLSNVYLGTASEEVAYSQILDETDNYGWGHVDLWSYDNAFGMNNFAFRKAPGCVEYILVDDYDPQDEYDLIPALGVGKHEVRIKFNRPMDETVIPWVTMGLRPPYNQKSISEDGYWSTLDPNTFVTHITIDGKSATDGLNRLRVMGYKQKDSDFEMPAEHYRFNVNVQAAGSMSTGMMAEPGLGKVTLTWETDDEDFQDLLGYNLYRFTRDAEGVCSDSVKINEMLIDAEEDGFIDYDVEPGTTYYYFLREIGTNLTQNDVSRTVAATPLTSIKGDANGSMTVDVADIMTEIAYLSDENPQPFIFEAADVNSDESVDILDVVGTLQIITNPEAGIEAVEEEEFVFYYIKEGQLWIQSPLAIGGVQVMLDTDQTADLKAEESVSGMENLTAQVGRNHAIFLSYSLSHKVLAPGEYPILTLGKGMELSELILSSPRGANIVAVDMEHTGFSTIAPEKQPSDIIYDLNGRRLNAMPQHGMVIVNGKKVIL